MQAHPLRTQAKRHKTRSLSRRLARMGTLLRGMLPRYGDCSSSSPERGFLVNWNKSRLTPKRQFQWLGIFWNTVSATLLLPEDKVESLHRDISCLLSKTCITRRQVEKCWGTPFCLPNRSSGEGITQISELPLKSHATKGLRDRKLPFPISLKRAPRRWMNQPSLQRKLLSDLHPPF